MADLSIWTPLRLPTQLLDMCLVRNGFQSGMEALDANEGC